jgi:hypothetical protein
MKSKNKVSNMTRKQLEKIPVKQWDATVKFSSMVLLPTSNVHDSGYGIIKVIYVDEEDHPICKTGGCSDVINLNGIGGLSLRNKEHLKSAWCIDLLPKSGLFRIWDGLSNQLESGLDLSSLEIFSKGK